MVSRAAPRILQVCYNESLVGSVAGINQHRHGNIPTIDLIPGKTGFAETCAERIYAEGPYHHR